MSTSINNLGVTFPDGTTQTTAATGSVNTLGGLGTYAFLYSPYAYNPGTILPASALYYSNGAGSTAGQPSAGTWRAMGFFDDSAPNPSGGFLVGGLATVCVRIA